MTKWCVVIGAVIFKCNWLIKLCILIWMFCIFVNSWTHLVIETNVTHQRRKEKKQKNIWQYHCLRDPLWDPDPSIFVKLLINLIHLKMCYFACDAASSLCLWSQSISWPKCYFLPTCHGNNLSLNLKVKVIK